MAQYNRRTVLTALGSSAVMFSSSTAAQENNGQADIAAVRRATSQYQDVEVAREDGYVEASPCESNPNGAGAMGVHFLNPSRLGDGEANPAEPEALMYEPQPNDGWDLVGVEYIVQEQHATEDPPSLFGEDFHGPHKVADDLPPQYDLHVWCWRANPNGMFASYNPNVSCE